MASGGRLPHLLRSNLSLPPSKSLVVLTSVINASTNWLLLRFLLCLDINAAANQASGTTFASKIVLVSFLRDWEFWRDGARRIGLDLPQLASNGHFTFVDGLSEVFGMGAASNGDSTPQIPGRVCLRNSSIDHIESSVMRCLDTPPSDGIGKTLLLVDGLDLLLAATSTTSLEISDMMMEWREHIYATVITASSDQPLLLSPSTPLEVEHATFVGGLVQQAHFVISLRLLSTGVAKDVSGVLRITRGSGSKAEYDEVEEKEVLYLVSGDRNVKVFERGSSD